MDHALLICNIGRTLSWIFRNYLEFPYVHWDKNLVDCSSLEYLWKYSSFFNIVSVISSQTSVNSRIQIMISKSQTHYFQCQFTEFLLHLSEFSFHYSIYYYVYDDMTRCHLPSSYGNMATLANKQHIKTPLCEL